MTKYFLKDLDETPLSGAGGKTRTFITRFGLVNKICTYISKKYFSIKLLLDKSRVLTVVRPRQNYCGFLFIAAAMNRLQLQNIGRAVVMRSQPSHYSITRIPDRLHILLNWDCCSHTLSSWTSKCSIVRTVFSYTAFSACLPIFLKVQLSTF